jgi:hypothetical protein
MSEKKEANLGIQLVIPNLPNTCSKIRNNKPEQRSKPQERTPNSESITTH